MKLICLGTGPCRCVVLRFRKANILLDCATPAYAALCAGAEDCQIIHDIGGLVVTDNGCGKDDTVATQDDAVLHGYEGDGVDSSGCHGADLMDLTPFLPLLRTLELHAALIGSAEALLGLPYLLQYDSPYGGCGTDFVSGGCSSGGSSGSGNRMERDGAAASRANGSGGARNGLPGRPSDGSAWHHVGPIKGPVYCTQAALDAAEQLVAERLAAAAAAAAAVAKAAAGAAACQDLGGGGGGYRIWRGGGVSSAAGGQGAGAPQAGVSPRIGGAAAAPVVGGAQTQTAAPGSMRTEESEGEERAEAGPDPTATQPVGEGLGAQHEQLPYSHLSYGHNLGLEVAARQEDLLRTCWRRQAPWSAVRHCLDRVRPVRYGQVVSLDSYELTAVPYPSGSGFGHAMWQVTDGVERCRTILYLPDAAPVHPFAPPLPLELVHGPDALILGPDILAAPLPLQPPPSSSPSSSSWPPPSGPLPPPLVAPGRPPGQVIKELVLRALMAGGSVLLPVYATGEAWELLEAVASFLAAADLSHVPLLYVGPRAATSLALAAVSLEALAPERQAAVYRPQHPFAFDALMQAGRLVTATSLQDPEAQRCLKQPAVVLASADSLLHRGGPALELLLRLGPDPHHVMVIPHAAPPAVMRAIQRLYDRHAAAVAAAAQPPPPAGPPPLRMRIAHVPLRGSGATAGPSPAAALDLLTRLQPRHLLLSSRDLSLLRQQQQQQQQQHGQMRPSQTECGAAPQGTSEGFGASVSSLPPLARESVVPYDWLHQVRVPLPRNVHDALVAPELLQKLQWLGAGPGLQLARLNCLLVFREGAWHADPVPGSSATADSVAAGTALVAGGAVAADQLLLAAAGGPSLTGLLEALAGHGVRGVAVATEGECTRLTLDGTDAELTLRPDGAHIHTSCPVLRHVLTDCLMRQLSAL